MKQNKKRKKLKLRKGCAEKIACCAFFIFSAGIYLVCSTFIQAYNNSVSVEYQKARAEIRSVVEENENLEICISTLSSRERITEIANASGLVLHDENIVTITEE